MGDKKCVCETAVLINRWQTWSWVGEEIEMNFVKNYMRSCKPVVIGYNDFCDKDHDFYISLTVQHIMILGK
jgi:hypothetical protein